MSRTIEFNFTLDDGRVVFCHASNFCEDSSVGIGLHADDLWFSVSDTDHTWVQDVTESELDRAHDEALKRYHDERRTEPEPDFDE